LTPGWIRSHDHDHICKQDRVPSVILWISLTRQDLSSQTQTNKEPGNLIRAQEVRCCQ
jgi:hypothetical protein